MPNGTLPVLIRRGKTESFHLGNSYIVKKILDKMTMNAEIDIQDKKGRTPLHCAVTNNNADIVELLVDR